MPTFSQTTTSGCTDSIICHCLQVNESTVADAVAICGLSSVKDVCRETGAGGGCTACHSRLKELLRHANHSQWQ